MNLWSFTASSTFNQGSEVKYLPVHHILLFWGFMLFIISSLIGRSEATCGPAGHSTESWELLRSESPLQEEPLTHVVTPLATMVTAQRHRQAQDRTRTWTRRNTRTLLCCWLIWGSEAFSWGFLSESWRVQQTAQSEIWRRKQTSWFTFNTRNDKFTFIYWCIREQLTCDHLPVDCSHLSLLHIDASRLRQVAAGVRAEELYL